MGLRLTFRHWLTIELFLAQAKLSIRNRTGWVVISIATPKPVKLLSGTFLLFSFLFGLVSRAESFYKSAEKDPQIQSFLSEIEGKLPPKLKAAFPQGIQVQFQNLSSHGRILKNGTLVLKSELLEAIKAGEKNSKPSLGPDGKVRSHKTEYREAQATLIHETAHAYDYLNLRSAKENAFIQECRIAQELNQQTFQEACDVYLNVKTSLSTDPYYLEIAGWPLAAKGQDFRDKKNTFSSRSADAYEFQNPFEHFAVNFEYFILDPEFACRKPSLHNLISSHFQFRPFNTKCEQLTYVNPSKDQAAQVIQKLPLDRVYQIHYLHAAKGQELVSRWGHSMFRLVICAPETKMGPDCMKDEYYHLVLSFRAFVGLGGINSWKSLTGDYSSRLFIINFREVKNSYVANELRDLVSYPLKLSDAEKKRFLEKTIETHWTYDNQYYFLSNNCAVESLNLLRASLMRPELMDKKLIMPNDLRDLLLKLKIVDESIFTKDMMVNRKRGLFFDNYADRYSKAYSMLTGKEETVKAALAHIQSSFSKRQLQYGEAVKNDIKKSAAVVILETASLTFQETNFRASIFENSVKLADSALKSTFENSFNFFHLFSAPYEFLSRETYGIPSEVELKQSEKKLEESWEKNKENKLVRSQLFDSLFSSEQKNELAMTQEFLSQATSDMQNLISRQ